VLTIIFLHHSSSSSLTLPKIFEILTRALKKARDDRGRSSTKQPTSPQSRFQSRLSPK
jgi:hypothetical protein